MFGFGRKKSQLEKAIEKDGIEHATDRVAEIVAAKIPNREIAYRFILGEIEAASMGNNASKIFAKNSGISSAEYKGALSNSIPEVDGPNGPYQLIAGFSMHLAGNQLLGAEFRCKVDDKIMKRFRLGKYAVSQGPSPSSSNTPMSKDEKLQEIARCVVDLTSESLYQIDLELTQSKANALVQTISQEMNDKAVASNDSLFIALQVVEILAGNALENEEYDALCMLALSVAWGTRHYLEEHQLSEEKSKFIEKMIANAMKMLAENKQFVKSGVATNFIGASILALCSPNPLDN